MAQLVELRPIEETVISAEGKVEDCPLLGSEPPLYHSHHLILCLKFLFVVVVLVVTCSTFHRHFSRRKAVHVICWQSARGNNVDAFCFGTLTVLPQVVLAIVPPKSVNSDGATAP